jgi:FAD dependent oxidoreductase TIGR03364
VERAVVVGGGILGTWHAWDLHQAGFEVDHLEADGAPVSASVRNFGLVWVSGRRRGVELDAAKRARARWEQMGRDLPGIGFRPTGSLTVALEPDERKVMEAYAAGIDPAERSTVFLAPDVLGEQHPGLRSDVAGALWCPEDAAVEPGSALGAIREGLASSERYRFVPGRRVVDVASGAVVDQRHERWAADVVVLAMGAWWSGAAGEHLADAPVRRVRLQMCSTAPYEHAVPAAIGDADTLRYYPAYESAPLDVLPDPSPVAAAHHLQLLLVQRLDGTLTIGDTHAYDEPFDFAIDERPTIELMEKAGRILAHPLPPITRRWTGVYLACTDDRVCYRDEMAPGVWVVAGPGGRGMTCAPAISQDTLAAAGVRA